MSFRCSVASLERGDDLAGTTSTVRAFLLVESRGPWGEDALRDSRLPDQVKRWLRAETARTHVRALLIRRVGRSEPGPTRVYAVRVDRDNAWIETTTVQNPAEITAFDLAALGAGRSTGLTRWTEPVVLVCTHGRHDACCAERGRPLARALAEVAPTRVWECSHLGGDRFAGNMLVLPRGLGFGRVEPADAPGLLAALDRGELDLDRFRGRATLPMPAQFAEVALRRQEGALGLDAVTPLGTRRLDPTTLVASFGLGGATYDVTVRTTPRTPARLTCHAVRDNPVPRHEVTAVTRTT
jgi:hypothetical protein